MSAYSLRSDIKMNEVRIILTGACGRMGRAVTEAAKSDERIKIVAGVDISASDGEFPIYTGISGVPSELSADVIVDFSHHSATEGILAYAKSHACAAIICTTGHDERELEMINEASKDIAVFRSGNMSLGINLLISLVKQAASVLEGYDIEIIEKHHNNKLDAPSGTAIMLEEAAAAGVSYTPEVVYERHSVRRKRAKEEIGIHSVRGGNIVGEHEVMFAGPEEIVTLSHSASSRNVFARGAIEAAVFICGKDAGLYNMQDVVSGTKL